MRLTFRRLAIPLSVHVLGVTALALFSATWWFIRLIPIDSYDWRIVNNGPRSVHVVPLTGVESCYPLPQNSFLQPRIVVPARGEEVVRLETGDYPLVAMMVDDGRGPPVVALHDQIRGEGWEVHLEAVAEYRPAQLHETSCAGFFSRHEVQVANVLIVLVLPGVVSVPLLALFVLSPRRGGRGRSDSVVQGTPPGSDQ